MELDWKLSDARVIEITFDICARYDWATEPWATADICEEIECSVNLPITSLPGAAFDRWLACLETRNAKNLDYDSPARHNARCDELGIPEYKI